MTNEKKITRITVVSQSLRNLLRAGNFELFREYEIDENLSQSLRNLLRAGNPFIRMGPL